MRERNILYIKVVANLRASRHYISPVIIYRILEACNRVLKIVRSLVEVSQYDN